MGQNDGEAGSTASLPSPPPLPPPPVDSETAVSEPKPKADRSFLRRAFARLGFESGDDKLPATPPATPPQDENGNFVPIADDSAQLESLNKDTIAEEMKKLRISGVIVIAIIVFTGFAQNLFSLLLLFTTFFE
ncbi:hypothetical protein QR680_017667 [Steinernema hermaphroditum]|uniref:Uncharacterized protein n=1 Tax=Steinernema hermaphroditum TaxID=289476 RepID=A0AA39LPQ1_9BILA|nr:hypothetical protein QR680_017667 [Steinernema hermaphroditum]